MNFKTLCNAIESVPEVAFTDRRTFFWSYEDIGAQFVFRGHVFVIETDLWDGALWVMTTDHRSHPSEIQVLREAVENAASQVGWLGRLWNCLNRPLP